jgi:hypothetical protein
VTKKTIDYQGNEGREGRGEDRIGERLSLDSHLRFLWSVLGAAVF